GELVLSNAVALSPPRSLLANVRGAGSAGTIRRALETNPDGVTLSLHQLVSAWNTSNATAAELAFMSGTTQCFVRASGNGTTWTIAQVCHDGGVETANTTSDTSSPIVHGRWQRFALSVAFAPTASVSLDIDGARTSVAAVAPLQRGMTSIVLGARNVPEGDVTLFQDNVLVTSP
ncbi:MAG: hypothetical protein K0S65_5527, partial [Labilithrix sp.]|nr:hypothetical protein [Labilithrix sp.]